MRLSPELVVSVLTLDGVKIKMLDIQLVLENWLVFSKLHTCGIRSGVWGKKNHRSNFEMTLGEGSFAGDNCDPGEDSAS